MMLLLLFGRSVTSDSSQLHGLQPARLLCPWHVPGKNTGVGFHFLLQWVFQTQGWDLYLWHWQVDSLLLSDLGSPSFTKPFNKLGNVSISPSSMSCSKLIKSQEEAVGTSDLKPEVVIAQSFPDFTTSNTSISNNIFPESFVYKFGEIATRRLVLLECLGGKTPLGDTGPSDNSS